MEHIGKAIASAVIVFLFMFSLIFCFDSPDRITNIIENDCLFQTRYCSECEPG